MKSATGQSEWFDSINQDLKHHNQVLFDAFKGEGTEWQFDCTDDAFTDGFDTTRVYFLKEGVISIHHKNNLLYTMTAGDILFPSHFRHGTSPHFRYSIEEKISVTTFSITELADMIGHNKDLVASLLEATSMSQFLLTEAIANLIESK